jgi:FixJ family two-component response regulator
MTPPDIALIAIVDDDQSAREALTALLRSGGYAVEAFASGDQLLTSTSLPKIHCVITDLMMPPMNGLELQMHLKAGGHRMPLIFVSAISDAKASERALRAGAYAYLTKVCASETLLACIASALAAKA